MNVLRNLVAVALVLLMQGPAMLVQEVAWVGMLVTYTQERGLMRGVVETFDGDHPCELCKKAEEIHQQEQPEDPAEKQTPARGSRLAWVEMVTSDGIRLPTIAGEEIPMNVVACIARDAGRGVDAPDSPPPERA